MLKKYTEKKSLTPSDKTSNGPSVQVINSLLNYSRSIKVVKAKKEKLLVHLN